jgi:glycerophosphoryl diester phosphodiesterase
MRNLLILSLLFTILSCEVKSSSGEQKETMKDKKSVEIQGHRGARGLWPENSLPGFLNTMDLGVSVLEMDVVLSKDGKVVVSHDPYFNPAICLSPSGEKINKGEEGSLYKMNYSEIAKYDCGSIGNSRFPNQKKSKVSKPLLSEVIENCLAKDSDVRFNIEIKSRTEWRGEYQPETIEEYVDAVVKEVNGLPYSQYNLQSFDTAVLFDLAARYPQVRLSYLIEEQEINASTAQDLGIDLYAISPDYTLLNAELVKAYQKQGLKVIPWTVNEVSDMKKLISWGVDGIISDYPDSCLKEI